jgi:CRISPR-associated RAMP protein (TIGR02581 family)
MPRHNEHTLSFAALQNRLIVAGTLTARTALRVGAGRSQALSGSDLPVLRDVAGRPFIPGASLKGALRARAEALLVAVGQAVHDFKGLEDALRDTFQPIISDQNKADRQKAQEIWSKSTLIDLTFGAPWVAGRLFVRDAPVVAESWFGQHEVRNGVGLNRDTETAEENILYNYEVTPAGTQFAFRLTLENAEDWQRGLVLLLLKPFERGEAAIGGFRSRGLGQVQLDGVTRRYVAVTDAASALSLLRDDPLEAGVAVDAAQEQEWIAAFETKLTGEAAHA